MRRSRFHAELESGDLGGEVTSGKQNMEDEGRWKKQRAGLQEETGVLGGWRRKVRQKSNQERVRPFFGGLRRQDVRAFVLCTRQGTLHHRESCRQRDQGRGNYIKVPWPKLKSRPPARVQARLFQRALLHKTLVRSAASRPRRRWSVPRRAVTSDRPASSHMLSGQNSGTRIGLAVLGSVFKSSGTNQ